jgi:hypothetical protein
MNTTIVCLPVSGFFWGEGLQQKFAPLHTPRLNTKGILFIFFVTALGLQHQGLLKVLNCQS